MTTEVLVLPEVLRVLAIDDNQICLEAVGAMLESCKYQVTKCRSGEEAVLLLLKDHDIRNRFDIILSNLHMPDINGIKLLDIIKKLELDVPVVIMSSDKTRESVMEAIVHGACDYITKPVAMETIQLLWQRVVRKRRITNNGQDDHQAAAAAHDDGIEAGSGRSFITNKRKKKINRSESSDHQVESSRKKPRMNWTPALHQQFVDAVHQLGYSNAAPKKIIKLMNLPGLTKKIVGSHLQRYRAELRRQCEEDVLQGRPSTGAINGDQRYNNVLEECGGGGVVGQQQPYSTSSRSDRALVPPCSNMLMQQQQQHPAGNRNMEEGACSRFLHPPPVSAAAMMQMAPTPSHPLPPITVTDHHHLQTAPTEMKPSQYCGGVASHLQKYRHEVRRQCEDSQKDEVLQGRPSTGAINGHPRNNNLLEEHGGGGGVVGQQQPYSTRSSSDQEANKKLLHPHQAPVPPCSNMLKQQQQHPAGYYVLLNNRNMEEGASSRFLHQDLPPPVSAAAMMQMAAQTPSHPLPISPPEMKPIQYCGGVSSTHQEQHGCYIAHHHHQPGNTSGFLLNNSCSSSSKHTQYWL